VAEQLYPITVPKWGIEMQEGTITAWHVAIGAAVEKGDELIDIETDKIVNTMEAPVNGVVCRQLVDEGETLKVGELLGVIATGDATDGDIDAFVASFVPADASFGIDEDTVEDAALASEAPAEAGSTGGEVRVSPVARRIALKLGVDLATVQGTGRNGRISKEDVERAAAGQAQSDSDATPLSSRRQTIARRLAAAKQSIPHYYVTRVIDMSHALASRSEDVSINAIIIKAAGDALKSHPLLNAHFVDDAITKRSGVDINMAVDTDEGLTAPLINGVDAMTAADLTAATRQVAERARSNSLSKEDLEPGGFTVSNLGVLGVEAFTAIINPPQTGILAVGSVTQSPVVIDNEVVVRPLMRVTLSSDHRVVDGADAARFLGTLAGILEQTP
jgi:pyruvate dehydrogenase E2 component (dihydrolipoamide acetyltransferase)